MSLTRHTTLSLGLFSSLVPPILPLPPLIKGHLLSFLSASSCVSSSPSLIGEFIEVSHWAVLSAPPLVTCHENNPPPFQNTRLLSVRTALFSLRLFRGAPPSPQAETKWGWGVSWWTIHFTTCTRTAFNSRIMSLTKGPKLT